MICWDMTSLGKAIGSSGGKELPGKKGGIGSGRMKEPVDRY